ncbi:MAG TPA: DUF4494 domain-containing protein [Prolixibacteraceae bacterium]|nr:DUF4494 domain-containing protein [Prolixibacteraceae bacterium]HPR61122.1 DUF4494 domain-containing protein [Prolixibacteraceae bacterium]
MQTWYECKVKYLKIDQGGYERKINDNYLLDAVSFTDAEARIFQKMQEITSAEFQVMNIKKSNLTEVIPSENGEWWYKAKISIITIDEEAGKEKKVNQYILVMADDIEHALKRLEEGLSYMLVPYVCTSIQLSTIADVFPYDDVELQDKVVSVSQTPESTPVEEPNEPFFDATDDQFDDYADDEDEDEVEALKQPEE